MADKCCSDVPETKKCRTLTVEMKLDVIKQSDKGESPSQIGRSLDLNRLTIGTIIKDKMRILQHIKGLCAHDVNNNTKTTEGCYCQDGKLLEVL